MRIGALVCIDQATSVLIPVGAVRNRRDIRRIYGGMRSYLFAPVLFLSLAVSANAREPLTIAVSPSRSFAPRTW